MLGVRVSGRKHGMSTRALDVARWTIADTAEYLGTSTSTVRRLIAAGTLPAYRYGPRLIRIDPEDVTRLRQPVTPLAELRGGGAR